MSAHANCPIVLPDYYAPLNQPLPPDFPEETVGYAVRTQNALCLAFMWTVPPEFSMPFDDTQAVIDDLNASNDPDMEIVEVACGKTNAGRPYIYNITRRVLGDDGVDYVLNMNIKFAGGTAGEDDVIWFVHSDFHGEDSPEDTECTLTSDRPLPMAQKLLVGLIENN